MSKTIDLVVTSAMMFEGELVRKGKILEGVPLSEASQYLRRGKVKLAPGQADDQSRRERLEAMKVNELKAEAADLNIEGHATLNKTQLVDAILAVADDSEGD